MSSTVSDFLVQRLAQAGVHRFFGYPGDGINGIMGALGRAKQTSEFIQVRHEEMAAFMAWCGASRLASLWSPIAVTTSSGPSRPCIGRAGPSAQKPSPEYISSRERLPDSLR